MMGKVNRGRVADIMLFAGSVSMMLTFMTACSKSAPKCDGGKAVTAVVDKVGQEFKKELAGIAGMGGPGMELSDDEWKTIRAGMIIDLDNIREQGFDEAAGKRTCAANLLVTNGGKKKTIPITYSVEVDRNSGSLKTEISGVKEAREAEPPLKAPE